MIIDYERRPADDKRLGNVMTRREAAAALLAFGGVSGSAYLSARSAGLTATQASKSALSLDGASVGSADFGLVRLYGEAFPPIAVQSIGTSPLPAWVEPDDLGTARCLEIVLVHESLPISDRAGVEPAMRIIIVDEAVGDVSLPECLFTIRGAGADLDTLAETLVRTVTGPTIVGIDFADLRSSASFRSGSSCQGTRLRSRGHAVLVNGSCADRSSAAAARTAVRALAAMGFAGGLFVAVLIGEEKAAESTKGNMPASFLYDFDSLMGSLMPRENDRPFMVTALPGASCDAIVIVAFNGRSDELSYRVS